MRFVFLNRFYWPDEPATAQLLADLAEALAARGHAVTIIASRPGNPSAPLVETHRGVLIRRVRGTRWSRFGLAGKAVDFATFYFAALTRLAFTAQRGDLVVALTDPPLIGIGAWLVARACGARIIHWVQDIYPEVAITLTGYEWPRVFRPLRNLAWRHSDACVTLGADMAAVLARAGVAASKIILSPNWAPAGLTPQPAHAARLLRAEWNLTGKFIALYSGNFGRVHDLEPLLEVAKHLRAHPHIALVFVGAGAQRAALIAEAQRRDLANVHFHPSQPRAHLAESLALGDVHFVTLRPGCETSVFPSKLYGIAAIGRPVVFVGPRDCELARLVRVQNFGLAFTRDEAPGIAAALVTLSAAPADCARLSAAALAFAHATGGADRAARDWAALAEAIVTI